jgi:hypothetical protein
MVSSHDIPLEMRAFPDSKALPAGVGATPQLRRLALSDTSIRRKSHESVMAVALNAEQERKIACSPCWFSK